jgi:hypothetical protein
MPENRCRRYSSHKTLCRFLKEFGIYGILQTSAQTDVEIQIALRVYTSRKKTINLFQQHGVMQKAHSHLKSLKDQHHDSVSIVLLKNGLGAQHEEVGYLLHAHRSRFFHFGCLGFTVRAFSVYSIFFHQLGGCSGFCKPFAYIVSSTAEPAFTPVKQDEMR